MRSTFSRTVPRRAWKTMPWSFSVRLSSGTFLSSSKKKRPSARRARMTLSLPLRTLFGFFAVFTTAR